MAIKVVANFVTLMRLAHEREDAEKSGDQEKIQIATKAHEDYLRICLEADEMSTGLSVEMLDRK